MIIINIDRGCIQVLSHIPRRLHQWPSCWSTGFARHVTHYALRTTHSLPFDHLSRHVSLRHNFYRETAESRRTTRECGPNDRSAISAAARTRTDGPPSCDVAARPFRITITTNPPPTRPHHRPLPLPTPFLSFVFPLVSRRPREPWLSSFASFLIRPFSSRVPLLARPSVKRGRSTSLIRFQRFATKCAAVLFMPYKVFTRVCKSEMSKSGSCASNKRNSWIFNVLHFPDRDVRENSLVIISFRNIYQDIFLMEFLLLQSLIVKVLYILQKFVQICTIYVQYFYN